MLKITGGQLSLKIRVHSAHASRFVIHIRFPHTEILRAHVMKLVQWFAAHLEQKCKTERAKSLFKTKPLHHKYSISLSVVCFESLPKYNL